MEQVDVVVVGAGWNGLVAAKTYLECHSSARLVVLESASTPGGVWAEHRLYQGLKSNNMLGTYEFSDFPMDTAKYCLKPGEHIPGGVVHRYLQDYACHFDVYRHIRFNCKADSAERQDSGTWLLTLSGGQTTLVTHKLILATGLTSEPFLPTFEGQSSFGSPVIHVKDLARFPPSSTESDKRIIVLGGTKSAWDAVYSYASSGVSVDWVIRESGHGPAWMAPAYVTPLKLWLEQLVHTRLLTWFSPCIWGDADGFTWIRWLLHCTILGRWLVDLFWDALRKDVESANNYESHADTSKLKPWVSPFWIAASLSILNYPTDVFELVRQGRVKVHIADISRLSSQTVHLSSGLALHAGMLVCATGWKAAPPITFLPPGIERALGLPGAAPADAAHSPLVVEANLDIIGRFRRLSQQPKPSRAYRALSGVDASKSQEEPYRLWRFMVPPACLESRSVAFCGAIQTISTPLVAQLQALWITAYLDGSLSPASLFGRAYSPSFSTEAAMLGDLRELPLRRTTPEKRAEWEAVLHTQFCCWRYPAGFSSRYPDFVFDAMPYMDMLLRDLGLRYRRKKTLWRECLEPYGPEDYRGLVDEWRTENGR